MRKDHIAKESFVFLIIVAVLSVVPLFGFTEYVMRILVLCGLYVMLSASLNLLSGVTGQVSVGHIAFYGIGSYTSALASMHLGMPFWGCLLLAVLITTIFGAVIAFPSLRLSGGYLALITMGFGEVIRLIMLNWMSLTRGPMGLVNVPSPVIFGITFDNSQKYFYLVLIICVVALIVLNNLIKSKFGRNLRAIKDDELAAEAMGINTYIKKVTAFIIAAAIAGAAGSLYAHLMLFVDPTSFRNDESTVVLSMVVLGGMGNMWGSVIAAVLLTILPELLRGFSNYRMLIYGILLVAIMLLKCVHWTEFKLVQRLKQKSE